MRGLLRPVLTTSALVVFGGCLAVLGGCASKAPQAEAVTKSAASPSASASTSSNGGAGATVSTAPGPASTSAGAGAAAPGDASASVGAAAGRGRPAGTPALGAQTPDERRAAIDKRLNDSLGSFDAELRKEQQKIAQERDARQATVTTVAATDPGGTPAAGQNGETEGSAATEGAEKPAASGDSSAGKRGNSRSGRAGDLKSDKSAGGANGNAAGNGAAANEIPDGNDDDIVARRLRKAAEQETDPELKEKLWKEYVEYKKNTQGK